MGVAEIACEHNCSFAVRREKCGRRSYYFICARERKNRKNILEVVIIGAVEMVEKPAKAYSSRKYGRLISSEQSGKAVENFCVTLWLSFFS